MASDQQKTLEKVRLFIKANALGVLSYIKTDATSAGAVVEFVVLPGPQLRLGFCTSYGASGYRKYPHITANPKVAVTFFNERENATFQAKES